MNISFLTVRNYVLLVLSLALGVVSASWLSGRTNSDTTIPSDDQSRSPAQFVQEPAQRSAFRPSFSRQSGVRYSNKRNNFLMLRAFQDAIGTSWRCAVQIKAGGRQVALGAVVGAEGWVITKGSQLPPGEVTCRLYDNREFDAEVVAEVTNHDLALLHIAANDLPAVAWEEKIPGRGKWLATIDLKTTPRSVGVVSTGLQRIRKSKSVLGVHLQDTQQGAEVLRIVPGTGADEAGLYIGDSIYEVNGIEVNSLEGFRNAIEGAVGGDFIKLAVNRKERTFEVDARLMDLANELLDETEMEVNGRISARATGFEKVFLHDTVLEPHQCGGPLVNLDGRVVGINIARAGRVTSYALPSDVVRPVVESLIAQAKLVSRNADSEPDLQPVR